MFDTIVVMSLPIGIDKDIIGDTSKALIEKRESLRSSLTGIVAATFGALVALHPSIYSSECCAWLYVAAVVANAISLIFSIFGLFGRYKGLQNKFDNVLKEATEDMTGLLLERKKGWRPQRFGYYMKIGLTSYIIAIILLCIYVVMDVCAKYI